MTNDQIQARFAELQAREAAEEAEALKAAEEKAEAARIRAEKAAAKLAAEKAVRSLALTCAAPLISVYAELPEVKAAELSETTVKGLLDRFGKEKDLPSEVLYSGEARSAKFNGRHDRSAVIYRLGDLLVGAKPATFNQNLFRLKSGEMIGDERTKAQQEAEYQRLDGIVGLSKGTVSYTPPRSSRRSLTRSTRPSPLARPRRPRPTRPRRPRPRPR
jgi:hypothetical protein